MWRGGVNGEIMAASWHVRYIRLGLANTEVMPRLANNINGEMAYESVAYIGMAAASMARKVMKIEKQWRNKA
jgi:hypothetical protein